MSMDSSPPCRRPTGMPSAEHAAAAAVVFREYGALSVAECWGDDVPEGKLTSFPLAVKRKDDETVVFSWVTWPSREVRDDGHEEGHGRPAAAARDPIRCRSTASA